MLDGYTQDTYNKFLHFMKAKSFYSIYKLITRNNRQWDPFVNGELIDNDCYRVDPNLERLILFLEKYRLCNQFLNSNRHYLDQFTTNIDALKNPETIQTYEHFKEILSEIGEDIKDLDEDIQKKVIGITCEECNRLDESLVDYSNHCLYSSVIMAVSAVEQRLHQMIKKLDNKRYTEEFENKTLGQIIVEFSDKGSYRDIKLLLPEKHLPLIQLLNKYRIFAVHPKNEPITPTIVDSILALSFTFITDPEISVYDNEELSCKS
jgi:hypothetical protein